MSFGKKSSKTRQQETRTDALDPQVKQILTGNYARAQDLVDRPYQPYTGQRVADFTPTQLQAQRSLLGLSQEHVGSEALSSGIQGAEAALNFRPDRITASGYTPTMATSATINRGDIRDVTGGPISAEAIRAYQDPYEQDVVNASLADLERQRGIEQRINDVNALHSHAFGGTGSAVRADMTNDTFARAMAQTAATLRSGGYQSARAAAQADAERAFQAALANQGVDSTVAGQNAGYAQQAGLANAAAQTDASRYFADQSYNAQGANQVAAQQAAQFNLQGATTLADLAGRQRQAALDDANLMGQVGAQEQAHVQAQLDALFEEFQRAQDDPYKRQAILNAAAQLIGNPVLTQSQGTSATNSHDFNFEIAMKPR